MIDQEIGADQVFHRVEHLGVVHDLIHPPEVEVHFAPPVGRQPVRALALFEALAPGAGLGLAGGVGRLT